MNQSKNILPGRYIQVYDQLKSWQEAVQKASTPLIEDCRITQQYVENMIKNVNDNGPYMVLSDYFALMHAQPDENVLLESISLLAVKEEVNLAGKPVKIFLILAAKDGKSHLEHLQKIVSIFMDENNITCILEGNKKAIETLFNKGD